ncbi:MAG TPA: hypothetical protein VN958_20475 [Chitinophagaceae bacterium]|nr:hypothetical protein [Chitinophagaceae bacterium]
MLEVKYLGVNYTGLIPIIISGMQDLKRENTTLKNENAQLKNDITQIKATLAKLTK